MISSKHFLKVRFMHVQARAPDYAQLTSRQTFTGILNLFLYCTAHRQALNASLET